MPVQGTIRSSHGEKDPRGDSPSPTLISNPQSQDPESASEFENGYTYALHLGTQGINAAGEQQWNAWASRSIPWRQGFAQALQGLGLGRFASTLLPQDQAKASSMNLSLLTLDVFGYRDEEDNASDAKIASAAGLAGGAIGGLLGAGAGAIGGGVGGYNHMPAGVFPKTIGVAGGAGLGALAGGVAGSYLGNRLGDESAQAFAGDDYTGTDMVGGPSYAKGVNDRLQTAMGEGLISKEEADAMRDQPLNAVGGAGNTLMGTAAGGLIGAGLGGVMGLGSSKPMSNMARIGRGLAGAAGGAVAGGTLGFMVGGRNAGRAAVDQQIGDLIDEDPSRAEPQFVPEYNNPHYGRAAVGAGLGALAGGLVGRNTNLNFAAKGAPPNLKSFTVPGAIAGGLAGGYLGYSNPVTGTHRNEPADGALAKTSEWTDADEADLNELIKVAGLGKDLVVGGAGTLAGVPGLPGVLGHEMGRRGYIADHPELTDREKSVAAGSGGLGRSVMALGAGGLGAAAGGALGDFAGQGIDATLGSNAFEPAMGIGGALAGGAGLADVVGRQTAADAVRQSRGQLAIRNAK